MRLGHELALSSGPSGSKNPRESRRANTSGLGVALCHGFSVNDVLKFSNSSIWLNFKTSIVLEEYYRVCMEEGKIISLMEKGLADLIIATRAGASGR